MKIRLTKQFLKDFKKLDSKIQKQCLKQITFLEVDIFYPSLYTEKLEPKHAENYSFRVNKSWRVIFQRSGEIIYLMYLSNHYE